MSKHTPGPWSYRKVPRKQEWEINTKRCPNLGHESWTAMSAVFGCDDYPKMGKIVGEANARLIAAAPELLEALRQCAEVLEHTAGSATGYCCCGDRMDTHADPMSSGHIPVDEGLYHAQRVADVARAAIAKATGEPS